MALQRRRFHRPDRPAVAEAGGRGYRYAFLAEHKHHNRRGVVQGGMLMAFADRSMGMTCWYANERQPQATVQLDVHFVDAVKVGEFVGRSARSCGARARSCS
jgi:acyl-coenzyme A thioesterase PaaI-like protein